jgi:hypothetical protein
MTSPVLAILGSTTETQKLFTLAKDGKLPFHCKAIDNIKEKNQDLLTYLNGQAVFDFSTPTQKYIMGLGNIIEPLSISSYYQHAIPKTAFVVMANKRLLTADWNLLRIEKSVPLVTQSVVRYELVKVLQSLRVIYSGSLEDVSIESFKMLRQESFQLACSIKNLNIKICFTPDPEEVETWVFSSEIKKLKLDLVTDNYELTTLLDPLGKAHYSYHFERRAFSIPSIWGEVLSAGASLQNLQEDDWKWVENV